jgi:hypothetical protein
VDNTLTAATFSSAFSAAMVSSFVDLNLVVYVVPLIFGYVDAFVPVYRSVVTKSDDQNGMHKMLSSSFTRDAVIDMKL